MSVAGVLLGSLSIFFILCEGAFTKGIVTLVSSVGLAWYPILVNACILELYPKDPSLYLQVSYGAFGVGALVGPYLVYWFEIQTYTALALLNFLFVFFYCYTSLPKAVSTDPLLEEKEPLELLGRK